MMTADWDSTSPLLSDFTSKVVVVVSLLLKEDLDFIIDYYIEKTLIISTNSLQPLLLTCLF